MMPTKYEVLHAKTERQHAHFQAATLEAVALKAAQNFWHLEDGRPLGALGWMTKHGRRAILVRDSRASAKCPRFLLLEVDRGR